MPRQIKIESVQGKMPRRYRVHPLLITIRVVMALALVAYSLYFLGRWVSADTHLILKILSLVILYIGLDSLFRHLTMLSSIIFTPECLWLRFPLKPSIPIPWENIEGAQLQKRITLYFILGYRDLKGRKRSFKTPASFPKMLEIMYNISALAPQAELNQELDGVVKYLKELIKTEVNE